MFSKFFFSVLISLFSQAVFGIENYVTQPTTPYPPGCVSNVPFDTAGTPSLGRVVFGTDLVSLTAWPDNGNKATVEMFIYRRGCNEPGRSVLMVSMQLIAGGDAYFLPRFFANINGTRYPLRLVNEPNSFEQKMGGALRGSGFTEFILDGVAESDIASTQNIISPTQYNAAFELIIQDGFDDSIEFVVQVKAFGTFPKPSKFPINGRLSGAWAVAGIPDQGFVISFDEFVDATGVTNLVVFSWYTYGLDGSMLWLFANSFHDLATNSVDLLLQVLSGGEFMGAMPVTRTDVGTAKLIAISCNELILEYNLETLGLGSGTVTLVRLFSVETAGYACRDQEARIEAL